MSIAVWVGLGSNLDNPVSQVSQALTELADIPQTQVIRTSSLYESEPFGPVEQDNFINAVAELITELDAHQLLDELQKIEQQHQRKREIHWGPRTLDLDILLFGQQQIATERLNVPHPYLSERNFVIYPLLEISPTLTLPDGRTLQTLAEGCPIGTLTQLAL